MARQGDRRVPRSLPASRELDLLPSGLVRAALPRDSGEEGNTAQGKRVGRGARRFHGKAEANGVVRDDSGATGATNRSEPDELLGPRRGAPRVMRNGIRLSRTQVHMTEATVVQVRLAVETCVRQWPVERSATGPAKGKFAGFGAGLVLAWRRRGATAAGDCGSSGCRMGQIAYERSCYRFRLFW